jgi:hypothetical protein
MAPNGQMPLASTDWVPEHRRPTATRAEIDVTRLMVIRGEGPRPQYSRAQTWREPLFLSTLRGTTLLRDQLETTRPARERTTPAFTPVLHRA